MQIAVQQQLKPLGFCYTLYNNFIFGLLFKQLSDLFLSFKKLINASWLLVCCPDRSGSE